MAEEIICKCLGASTDWSIKDYVPLISSTVVIALFIVDRWMARNIRKKEVERNFYYKVLLEPNLDKIFSFFDEVEELYESSANKLKVLDDAPVSEYLSAFRSEVELFKDKKRKFEFQLIFPIQQRYPKEAEILLATLNDDIQDYHIGELDSLHFDNASIIKFNKELHKLRAKFLSNLYKPLS